MNYRDYQVLYVDDELPNRVVLQRSLEGQFSMLLADSGKQALEILAVEPVAVLLTDQRMPHMTGVELATLTRERYPDIVRVIITAYSDLGATIDAINMAHVSRFIKKPWQFDELIAVLKSCISSYATKQRLQQVERKLITQRQSFDVAATFAAVAHDVREPLSIIEPSLEWFGREMKTMLEGGELSGEAKQRLQQMAQMLKEAQSGAQQVRLICETLVSSIRQQRGEPRRLDLRLLVEGVVALNRVAILERAVLDCKLPEEPVWIVANEGAMLQMLLNLISNAVHAVEPGRAQDNRITIRLGCEGEMVRLVVEDTGRGIAEDRLESIFQPLYSEGNEEGCGLGLSICLQVVEQVGGRITVESVEGEGARFVVLLPGGGRRESAD